MSSRLLGSDLWSSFISFSIHSFISSPKWRVLSRRTCACVFTRCRRSGVEDVALPCFRLTEATLPASRVAPSVVVSFSPRLRPRRAGACPFALGVARLPGFAFRLIRPVPLGSCRLFRPQRRSPPRHFCSFCSLNMARFTPYVRVHVHRCRCAGGDSAVDLRSS